MRLLGISRIFVALSLAILLTSLFQNCSKVNFGVGDSKALVQGGITEGIGPASPGGPDAGMPESQSVVSGAPGAEIGICLLTCVAAADDDMDENEKVDLDDNSIVHALKGSLSAKDSKMCASKPKLENTCDADDDDDGMGAGMKPVIQSISSGESRPKTACMSKAACDMIGANLLKGKMVLMKVASNRVSSLKGTRLQAVSAKSECEDELSDKEVKAQLEVNSK